MKSFMKIFVFRISKHNKEFSFYQISFLWYPMLACSLTVVIGIVVSIITKSSSRGDDHQSLSKRGNNDKQLKTRINYLKSNDTEKLSFEPFLHRTEN